MIGELSARRRRRRRHLEIQVHILAGDLYGVFKLDFDSHERYLDFETWTLHRIPSRIYLAE